MAGEEFVKKIKPFGCVLFLFAMVVFFVYAFGSGKAPIKDYEVPQTTEYYAEHLDELADELEENVLPHIDGAVSCAVGDGVVTVTLRERGFAAARGDILHYFDVSLFEFVKE